MFSLPKRLVGLTTAATLAAATSITKDVVIIGGGASGSYAGIRLKEDFGKSIALIEMEDILVSLHCSSLSCLEY